MLESNSDVLKGPLFASGVHADCHRCAGTKRSQQQIIGRSAGVFAAGRNRFIGRYSMPADTDLLSEAVSASTDDTGIPYRPEAEQESGPRACSRWGLPDPARGRKRLS